MADEPKPIGCAPAIAIMRWGLWEGPGYLLREAVARTLKIKNLQAEMESAFQMGDPGRAHRTVRELIVHAKALERELYETLGTPRDDHRIEGIQHG
jgi:hypothetical protein